MTICSFCSNKNGTNQTGVNSAQLTQVTFGNELYDTTGTFASSAWTPPAGKVWMGARFYATGTMGGHSITICYIYKDGAPFAQAYFPSGTNFTWAHVVCEDLASGSNVYTVVAYITTSSGTATISGAISVTNFYGHCTSIDLTDQAHFRFRTDADAVDNTPTWGAGEDANFDPGAANFRLRFGVQNAGDGSASPSNYQLYVSKNSGAAQAVTTSSTLVKSADASSSADDASILVPRLTLPT